MKQIITILLLFIITIALVHSTLVIAPIKIRLPSYDSSITNYRLEGNEDIKLIIDIPTLPRSNFKIDFILVKSVDTIGDEYANINIAEGKKVKPPSNVECAWTSTGGKRCVVPFKQSKLFSQSGSYQLGIAISRGQIKEQHWDDVHIFHASFGQSSVGDRFGRVGEHTANFVNDAQSRLRQTPGRFGKLKESMKIMKDGVHMVRTGGQMPSSSQSQFQGPGPSSSRQQAIIPVEEEPLPLHRAEPMRPLPVLDRRPPIHRQYRVQARNPPVVEEPPVAEQPPVEEQASSLEELPVEEQISALEEPPVEEEPPVSEQEFASVVEQRPVVEQPLQEGKPVLRTTFSQYRDRLKAAKPDQPSSSSSSASTRQGEIKSDDDDDLFYLKKAEPFHPEVLQSLRSNSYRVPDDFKPSPEDFVGLELDDEDVDLLLRKYSSVDTPPPGRDEAPSVEPVGISVTRQDETREQPLVEPGAPRFSSSGWTEPPARPPHQQENPEVSSGPTTPIQVPLERPSSTSPPRYDSLEVNEDGIPWSQVLAEAHGPAVDKSNGQHLPENIWNTEELEVSQAVWDKWVNAFDQGDKEIIFKNRRTSIPVELSEILSERLLEQSVIDQTLQTWLKKMPAIQDDVAILPSMYINRLTEDAQLRELQFHARHNTAEKRFIMMPYLSLSGAHWFLMIYTPGKFIVVDSITGKDTREHFQNDVPVFAHILTKYVGIDADFLPPLPEMNLNTRSSGGQRSDDDHHDNLWSHINHLTLKNPNDPRIKNFMEMTFVWNGAAKQTNPISCGYFVIMHAVYLARNHLLIEDLSNENMNVEGGILTDDVDITAVKRSMFAGLGSVCETRMLNSRGNSEEFDYPACLGLDYTNIIPMNSLRSGPLLR